ncbi:MAG TPA: glycoside hydrolase family 2 TIM barrel-domain containing protein [Sphingomonas sp.]|uniref:glycoside hydrolase family 2 TIM barrel-domain containing protein n=1 Tax=Sphingomonas sp. TaxID=28214 RepID=UPI002CEA347A|nr:glycoside hydrolase family 2 TIM barrel-domain containing protein [Sphingomonas sp.]HMI18664.1 glycoside hydrolase family 2 TIM barrel-domain containing protein [Sphingomonas sp.]
MAGTEEGVAPVALTRRESFALAGVAGAVAIAGRVDAQAPDEALSLLYPFESPTRSTRDLSGLWRFKLDRDDAGEKEGWQNGLTNWRSIPVPASWQELFDDARNYVGAAWYETDFQVDPAWRGRALRLRFGSAVYRARVWLNGKLLGEHRGGHLPFVFDIGGAARFGEANRLSVMVENKLERDRVPNNPDVAAWKWTVEEYPQTSYDFFPFAGLHRQVWLCALPQTHITDVVATTVHIDRSASWGVQVEVSVSGRWSGEARVQIEGGESRGSAIVHITGGRGTTVVAMRRARFWSTGDPFLHRVTVMIGGAGPIDEYAFDFGMRTIEVRGTQLLLNGEPVQLRGFGKHEDFFFHGKGLDLPVLVRDYELLKWIGANSFRTSHYPYAEEALMLADRVGLLVIAETPGVSLTFSDEPAIIEARRRQLRADLTDMVRRDRNRACVIAWSIGNEPLTKPFHTIGDAPADAAQRGKAFFDDIFDHIHALDRTRPATLVSVQGGPPDWLAKGDFICTNSYDGWYAVSARMDDAAQVLEREMTALHALYPNKPLMITEFGADAVAGMHDQPALMWDEEYQAEVIAMYLRFAAKHDWVIGTHPWAFADFRTSQSTMRVDGLNFKGVFTRDRRPKLAAHKLRALWNPNAA